MRCYADYYIGSLLVNAVHSMYATQHPPFGASDQSMSDL
jgi:hypothetical protein